MILIVWSKENEISTSMIGTREEPEATRTVAVHMIATSLFYSLKNWSTKLSNKIKQMEEMKPHFYSPYNSFFFLFFFKFPLFTDEVSLTTLNIYIYIYKVDEYAKQSNNQLNKNKSAWNHSGWPLKVNKIYLTLLWNEKGISLRLERCS